MRCEHAQKFFDEMVAAGPGFARRDVLSHVQSYPACLAAFHRWSAMVATLRAEPVPASPAYLVSEVLTAVAERELGRAPRRWRAAAPLWAGVLAAAIVVAGATAWISRRHAASALSSAPVAPVDSAWSSMGPRCAGELRATMADARAHGLPLGPLEESARAALAEGLSDSLVVASVRARSSHLLALSQSNGGRLPRDYEERLLALESRSAGAASTTVPTASVAATANQPTAGVDPAVGRQSRLDEKAVQRQDALDRRMEKLDRKLDRAEKRGDRNR